MTAGRPEATAADTLDAFHRGRFHLVQPAKGGHRAGVDAMILASTVPSDFAGHLADLGAGAGAAGLAVASRCPLARVLLVEKSAVMADYAARTLAHPSNADLKPRVALIQADVTLAGRARIAAGLADNVFDFAIMNPPFNAAADRRTPDAVKAEAHVMEGDLFEQWLRTAAAIVKPGGHVALIARPASMPSIFDALAGRFGGATLVAVQPRAQEPAIRIVVRAVRGSRAGLTLDPALVLHGETGHGFTERAEAINNGRAGLFDRF